MTEKPSVFLLEATRSNIDTTKAASFGEIKYIFEQGDRRSSVFETRAYEVAIEERLNALGFDPARDIVCIAGRIVCVAVLFAVLTRLFGRFNILMFDAHDECYVMRTVGNLKGDSNGGLCIDPGTSAGSSYEAAR